MVADAASCRSASFSITTCKAKIHCKLFTCYGYDSYLLRMTVRQPDTISTSFLSNVEFIFSDISFGVSFQWISQMENGILWIMCWILKSNPIMRCCTCSGDDFKQTKILHTRLKALHNNEVVHLKIWGPDLQQLEKREARYLNFTWMNGFGIPVGKYQAVRKHNLEETERTMVHKVKGKKDTKQPDRHQNQWDGRAATASTIRVCWI